MGPEFGDLAQGGFPIGGLTDHIDIRNLAEYAAEASAHQVLIIDDEYAYHSVRLVKMQSCQATNGIAKYNIGANNDRLAALPSPGPQSMKTSSKISALLRRLAALAYDLMAVFAVIFVADALVVIPAGIVWGLQDIGGHPLFQLYQAAIIMLFFGWFWTHGGQTLGLRAWKLKVVKAQGGAVDWKTALLRMAAGLLSLAPAGLGLLWMLFDRDGLAWHDRMSRTRVVSSTD